MRHLMLALPILAAGLGVGCATLPAGERPELPEAVDGGTRINGSVAEQVGDMRFEYSPGPGVRLSAFGIPVMDTSLMVVTTPEWGPPFFVSSSGRDVRETVTVQDYRDGRRIIIGLEDEEYDFPVSMTKTITLLPDNTYHQRLDILFKSDDPAILEWRVGSFSPNLVAGLDYTVTTDGTVREGTIPYESPGPSVDESTVARGFDQLAIASRIGDIVIESTPDDDLIFFDYRRNVYAEDTNPMFWFGYLERPLPAHTDVTYELTLRLPESFSPAGETVAPVTTAAEVEATETARAPDQQRDYVIPKPKELEFTEGDMPLGPDTVIYTGANPGRGIETAVDFLVQDLRNIYRIEPRVVRGPAPEPPPTGAILLGETDRYEAPANLLSEHGLDVPEHHEGYALRVGDGHAAIAANTEQGVFYGVTTLVQLVTTGENRIMLRGAEVVDWPSLDFRGIHALSGRDAGDEISKAVRELMARYKINSFIWECQYIIWDNAPELEHPEYGMEKEDARKVIEAADRYFINLIPLVQSLGHSEWIFTGGHNLDIAEDPATPYAYMVTNPRTYEFIFTIFQEALDFFEPEGFHIGHDEVTMRGRFPYRSKDSGMSVTELVMKDTIKLNDWFRERDIDVYLWGDMFLHSSEAPDATFAKTPEEAQERRDQLPRDMTVTDWHYVPVEPEQYTSIPLWRDEGFRTIGAGWFNPMNIRNLALACIREGVEGYLQTTWAGFNFRIDGNEDAWFQYWVYITAAHYAWSGDESLPDELPFKPKNVFIDTWHGVKPLLESREGFHVDLRGAFNRSLVDEDGTGWLGFGPENDFRAVPEGDHLLAETMFRLQRDEDGQGAIILSGRLNPAGEFPEAVTLGIGGETADELRFLTTAAFSTRQHELTGRVEVAYSDGTAEGMDLRYGQNLFAFHKDRAGADARVAWQGRTGAGATVRLWDLVWQNPHPEKPIEAITISSTGTEAAPIILAITGVR